MHPDVLLIDDDAAVRESLEQAFGLAGIACLAMASGHGALEWLRRHPRPSVVVSDVRLQGEDGLQVMAEIGALDETLPVILITGHGDIDLAVRSMRSGAFDFLPKPFCVERLLAAVRGAIDRRRQVEEPKRLALQPADGAQLGILGRSPGIEAVRRWVTTLGPTDVDVLLFGETGTGKEVVARALHVASGRTGPFVAVNCGGLPESLFDSEMFGHEPGAFTGATRRRIGKLEHARAGTVFLDEIESMPLALQTKLLRTLQERSVERLGGNALHPVDCRFIAATKVDLLRAAEAGTFRADLYFRLEVATLVLPPLRERTDDIPILFAHFAEAASRRFGVAPRPWTVSDVAAWQQRPWPGNVRELRNFAERWCLGLDAMRRDADSGERSLAEILERTERHCIERALEACHGNVQATADALGLPRKTLYDKLNRFGIDPRRYRSTAD